MTEITPEDVSDAGLEIMADHLREAYERIGRAAERSDGVELNEMGTVGTTSFHMMGAAADLEEAIQNIEREMERRDAQ